MKRFNQLLRILPLLLVLAALSVAAQDIQYSQSKSDYNSRSSFTVNPLTLALELNLPLGNYPGRAGMGLPISVNYSSKVWQTEYAGNAGMNVHGQGWGMPTYAKNSTAGWNISIAEPRIENADLSHTYTTQGYPGGFLNDSYPPVDSMYIVQRLYVKLPDGSSSEFRKSDTPALANGQGGTPDPNGTYYAVDGSGMKLVYNGISSWMLYLPDGSKYTPTEHIDRNGNKQIFYFNTSTGEKQWTDNLGRVVSAVFTTAPVSSPSAALPSQTTGGDKTYSLPGKDGVNLNYIFRWRQLKNATTGESVLSDPNQALKNPADYTQCDGSASLISPSLFTSVTNSLVCNDVSHPELFNPVVLSELELPNGQKYRFKYNIYGEVETVYYPTGGYEKFTYGQIQAASYLRKSYALTNRGVTEQRISSDGVTEQAVWQYSAGYSIPSSYTPPYKVTVTAPDGTLTERYLHSSSAQQPFDMGDGRDGMAYDERTYASASSGGGLLRRTLTDWLPVGTFNNLPRGPKVVKRVEIALEAGSTSALTKTTAYTYDNYLNGVSATAYDFATVGNSSAETSAITAMPQGAALQTSETDYSTDAGYIGRWMTGLPTATRLKNAAGSVVAKSEITYDEIGSYPLIATGTNAQWQDPLTNYRGNVTTTKNWSDITNNQFVQTHTQYDNFGNLRKSWDAKGNVSTTDYSSTYQYAYPTTATSPIPDSTGQNGSTTALTTSTVYDFTTGIPTSVTDANGQTSNIEYNDILLRPTKTIAPNGHQTITEYGAGTTAATRYVKVRTQIDGTNWKEGYNWYDGLGRTVKSQSIESTSGDVFTETQYDNMGRVKKVSNPHRTSETVYWTESFYDDLSRVTKVKTPDLADVNTAYSMGTGTTMGTVVTVTDQALRQRRSVTNALGQVKRVDEPDANNSLGTIDAPVQATTYSYNTLNNLTTVNQGSQTRSFVYDSLSRLKSATNPELGTTPTNGTINYSYDANGNLITKIDARNITTTFGYDNLNRVLSRSYNDGVTPAVSYFYDNVQNAKGKLIKVSSSVSTTEYTSFDTTGRVLSHKQTTDGTPYTTFYSYNLSGALLMETYPSTRVVRNVLDSGGDLEIVQSKKKSTTGFWNYADHFSYTAAGAVSSMQLGNNKWESTQFNSRLQPTQIALGTVQNGSDNLKLDFDYGTTANNGNVLSQTITVPTVGNVAGFTATQNYTYDSLSRLKSAQETMGGSQNWKQTFTFDRYGNRNFDTNNTTTLGTCSQEQCNPSIDTANNRFTTGQGYTYDNAGNTITDASSKTFTYDGENKQTKVQSGSTVIGEYFYDGDGKRVKKYVPSTGEITVFVYDASSKMVAEYSTVVASSADAKVNYLTNDNLGSSRITTDANGVVISRRDFMPFGEEVARIGYGSDSVRQKFTSYERDNETDLDFAEARYYNKQHGRFNSADEPFIGQDFVYPQTLNLFSYTSNNPLSRVDPDGHRWYTRDIVIDGKMTRQLNWVNPNDDGSYTAPEGEGWEAFIPTDDNRTFAVGVEQNRVIYLGENADGSPIIGRVLWTGATEHADEDIITAVSLISGSWSIAKGIFGRAFMSWAVKQTVKTLTSNEIGAIGEKALAEFLKNEGKATFETSLGKRIVDNLVRTSDEIIANESKVGRVGMKAFIRNQILKDAELVERGEIDAAAWHFFKSPKTGKIGPTPAVRKMLESNGIKIVIHQ